ERDAHVSCPQGDADVADVVAGRLLTIVVRPNTVDLLYEAHTSGVLTLTDAFAPGWTATVGGQAVPLLRVDGAFRGVCLDAPGTYQVSFRYRPPTWRISLGLAAAGLTLLAALQLAVARGRTTILVWLWPTRPPAE